MYMSPRRLAGAGGVAVLLVLLLAAGTAQAADGIRDGEVRPDAVDEENKTKHNFGYVVPGVSNDGGSNTLLLILPGGVTSDELSSFSGNVTDEDTRESISISSSPSIVDGPDGDGVHETVTIGVQPEGEQASRDLIVNFTGYVKWPDVAGTTDLAVKAAVTDSGGSDVAPTEFVTVTVRDAADDDPEVETRSASAVDASSATLEGAVTSLDGADSVEVSFAYWEEGARDATRTTTDGQTRSSTGAFTATVDGLASDTTHVFRAIGGEAPDGSTSTAGFTTAADSSQDGTGGDGSGSNGNGTPEHPALALASLAGAALARRR
jgi:MYXO-CTERM domain-containing protein